VCAEVADNLTWQSKLLSPPKDIELFMQVKPSALGKVLATG
jgi:hypothetical protein